MQELRRLDLNLLKALSVLLDEQNVSRAAEKMALSQSAMSAILAKLRDSFTDPLFVTDCRQRRGQNRCTNR